MVSRFQDMAVAYARSVLRDQQLAEDASQEAFVEALMYLDRVASAAGAGCGEQPALPGAEAIEKGPAGDGDRRSAITTAVEGRAVCRQRGQPDDDTR